MYDKVSISNGSLTTSNLSVPNTVGVDPVHSTRNIRAIKVSELPNRKTKYSIKHTNSSCLAR